MAMAGLSYSLKVQLQSSSLFQKRSKYHRLNWLLKEPQPPSFHPLQGVNKCVWGQWAGSLTSKNALAKLLASAASQRPFGPTSATRTHSTQHTQTQTRTGSQPLPSTWDGDRHSTDVAPRLPWGLGLQERREEVGGTGAPLGSPKKKVQAEVEGERWLQELGLQVLKFPDTRCGPGAHTRAHGREGGGAGALGRWE